MGGVAVEGVGDGRCGVVGGVAVEGVGDGRCGVVGRWASGFTLHAVCIHVPTSYSTVMSTSCTVHHIHILLLPHMMYGRGPYPR